MCAIYEQAACLNMQQQIIYLIKHCLFSNAVPALFSSVHMG